MSRTGHRIYEVDGIMVADPTQPITGDDTGTTPGAPLLSGGSGGDLTLSALDRIGTQDRQLSYAKSVRAYSGDTTSWIEQWADASAWTLATANSLQVSAGGLFGQGAANLNRLSRPFSVATGGMGHARALLRYVAGGDSNSFQFVSVGGTLNTNAFGVGIYGGGANAGRPYFAVGAAAPSYLGAALPAGDYVVDIYVDEVAVSAVITNAARTVERGSSALRSATGAISFLTLYNPDNRELTGSSIRQVGGRPGSWGTFPQRSVMEGLSNPVIYSYLPDGVTKLSAHAPASWDSLVPMPLVNHYHLFSGNELDVGTFSEMAPLMKSYADNGMLVVAMGDGNNWGNQTGLDKALALYRWARDHFPIGAVIGHASSMGGLYLGNLLTRRTIPFAAALFFQSTIDLAWACTTPSIAQDGTFGPSLRAAYGIASDYSDYATKIAGYNPMASPASAFRGIPILVETSAQDTTALKGPNGDALVAKLQAAALNREVDVVAGSGAHNNIGQFPAPEPTAFIQRAAAA